VDKDPLFVGPTLPSLLFGVPYTAWGFILFVPLFVFLLFENAQVLLLIVPAYAASRVVCLEQPRIFRFIGIWFTTKLSAWLHHMTFRTKCLTWSSQPPRRY
jgi:type IV secretion system protein VirB3